MEQLFNPNSWLFLIPVFGSLILLSGGGLLTSVGGGLRFVGIIFVAFGGVLAYMWIINYWPKSDLASIIAPILVLGDIFMAIAIGNRNNDGSEDKTNNIADTTTKRE